jgi:hypothetical protein
MLVVRSAKPVIGFFVFVALVLLADVAQADRSATSHERKMIAKEAKLPEACAKVRVSKRKSVGNRKFAKVHARSTRAGCSGHAHFGVVVLVRYVGEWHSDIESRRIPCLTLFKTYPGDVVLDLFERCS